MEDEQSLLPTYTSQKTKTIKELKFPTFAIITVGLPFGAFIFCVCWSIAYNFRESTATHCQVENYLPSVSAAIGSFSPQKHIWTMCILLHFLPRLYIARLYFVHLKAVLQPGYFKMARATWLMNVIEVTCLLGLTLISSTDFYPAHAFFFMTFILTSIVHMLLSCYLLNFCRQVSTRSVDEHSLRLKSILTATNLFFFFLAGYCFVRHNTHCEDHVYSWFAFCEYVVVLTNMGFHMTAYMDFYDRIVIISSRGISFR